MNNHSISPENAKLVMELAVKLAGEGDLVSSLASRLPNIDAVKAATDLDAGIERFDAAFGDAADGDAQSVIEARIDEILSGKTDEEKDTLLSEIVKSFGGDPGNLSHADLKKAVIEYMDNAVLSMGAGNGIALDALGAESASVVCELVLQGGARRYVAAALFILRAQGKLPEVSAALGTEALGVFTAAAAESERVVREAAAGKTTWEKAKALLKLIAAIAATIALAILINNAALAIALGLVAPWPFWMPPLIFIDFGILHALIVVGLVFLSANIIGNAILIAEKAKGFVAPGIDVVVEYWKKVVAWIKDELLPNAKELWNSLMEKAAAAWETAKDKISELTDAAKERAAAYSAGATEEAENGIGDENEDDVSLPHRRNIFA